MFVRIISDCRDDNARGRVETRIATLLGITPGFTGVANDLEAAGNLVDILAAGLGRRGIVIVNVAPRDGKRENGSPFGVFQWKETTVLTTIDGMTLSLVRMLGICEQIKVIDFDRTLDVIASHFGLSDDERDAIRNTQFRGLEFQPFCAALLAGNEELPGHSAPITVTSHSLRHTVWWIDNFGNVKLTTSASAYTFAPGSTIEFRLRGIPFSLSFYPRLKDVPKGQSAIIQGSSGIGDQRFLEIVVKGESAAKRFGIASGETLLELPKKEGVAVGEYK